MVDLESTTSDEEVVVLEVGLGVVDALVLDGGLDDVGTSLLGAFRSPSTFLGTEVLLEVFFLTSAVMDASMFSSSTASDEATLEDAFVVRVERVERVAFLTGMVYVFRVRVQVNRHERAVCAQLIS